MPRCGETRQRSPGRRLAAEYRICPGPEWHRDETAPVGSICPHQFGQYPEAVRTSNADIQIASCDVGSDTVVLEAAAPTRLLRQHEEEARRRQQYSERPLERGSQVPHRYKASDKQREYSLRQMTDVGAGENEMCVWKRQQNAAHQFRGDQLVPQSFLNKAGDTKYPEYEDRNEEHADQKIPSCPDPEICRDRDQPRPRHRQWKVGGL